MNTNQHVSLNVVYLLSLRGVLKHNTVFDAQFLSMLYLGKYDQYRAQTLRIVHFGVNGAGLMPLPNNVLTSI